MRFLTAIPFAFHAAPARRSLELTVSGEGNVAETPLDIARGRDVPAFFIVDDALRIVFATCSERLGLRTALPDDVAAIVRRIRPDVDRDPRSSAVGVLSPTQIVRVQQLEGRAGERHYAVFLERFAARNSVQKAAERFKLSPRETEVLEGLMRGDSTDAIAAHLGISGTTVHEHIRKIGRKTHVTKRSAIVATVYGLR